MTFYEKNYVMLIIASFLIILTTFYFPNAAIKINNLIILIWGTILGMRFNEERKEYEKRNPQLKKSNWFERFFMKTDIMDEREKLIHLKTSNISFIFALLISYAFFYAMNDLNMFEELKSTWFFYVLGGFMFCKGAAGLIYSRLISIAY